MEEQVLVNISKLFPLLHSTYQAINLTYQVLDVNCYEQQNVLKRWILPVKEESYECTCTPDFEEPEDMVNDIQCAVERAKTTRKIMKVNDKRYNRSEVTNSPLESLKTNRFKVAQKGKVNDSINKNSEKCSIKSVGNEISADERDIHTHHVKQREPKLRTNIKINKAHTFQTTYQKDFSVRNSHKMSQTIANRMKHPVKQCATTVDIKVENAENVDSLLEKVSTGFCKNPDVKINSFQNVKGDNCILHGEISQRVVHRCVNLNEAMNSLGAPPELVKLLRTFHQYVNVADKLQLKRKCSKQSFLQKLNESNQYWHRADSEPVIKLCLRYLLAFVNIIPKKFEWSGINLKEMEEEFNLLSQSYNKRLDFNEQLSEKVFCVRKESELIVFENTAKKIHWALTGVWNRKCWSMFSGLKDMLKISYGSKEDCLALHQKIQDIQKLQLQVEILIFLKNSFPFLNDLQNDHIALAHLYKSYSALCNISSVMVPVLLKN